MNTDEMCHERFEQPAAPSDTHLLRDAMCALRAFVENIEPDPSDPMHGRILSNGFARWDDLESNAVAILERARKAGVL